MSDLTGLNELLEEQGRAVEDFKKRYDAKVTALESEVKALAIAAGRPAPGGGGTSFTVGGGGKRPQFLNKGERLSQYAHRDETDWTLADFVRSGMGIRTDVKNVISSPATVPLYIGSEIIDDVREIARVTQAGARIYPIDGPTNFCRIDGDPDVTQHAEGVDDLAPSSPVFTPVVFKPQTLAALVPLSLEVVADSANLDAALRTSLASAFALKLDQLAIVKILADVNIPSEGGEDCATWTGLMKGVSSALLADQDIPLAMISNAGEFAARAAEQLESIAGWLGPPAILANTADLFTTGMPTGSAVIGNFARGIGIAVRMDLTLETIRYGSPTTGSHLLVAVMRAEAYVTQPKALYKVVTAA